MFQEFKSKHNIIKLNYKESIIKAIERLSHDDAWASWYYDEVILEYSQIIKNIKKNKY